MARTAFASSVSLHPAAVARISREAAESASRPAWWRRLVPVPSTPLLATAVPLVVATIALGVGLSVRHGGPAPSSVQAPARIDMQVEVDGVRLAWSDGRGRAYRVYKTSDPRLLGQGQGTVVQGNQWVDRDPGSSQVVFYRVE